MITGENFLEQSVVDFGGKTIKPTRRREQTELVIQLTPTDLAHARSVEVRVVNGPNRGGDSDPAPFEIKP